MTSILWTSYAWFFERFTRLLPYQELVDEVLGKLDPQPNQTILDAGCGPGALLSRLFATCPTVKVWAVDFSSAMIGFARRRNPWPQDWVLLQADLDQFLDGTSIQFDRIACVNVLWALPDPVKTLKRLTSHLSAHGKLVLAIPKKRFRADRIFLRHLANRKGLKRVWALLSLVWLVPGLFLNLLLVIQSFLTGKKNNERYRFYSEHIKHVCEEAGLWCEYEGPCYADQDVLIVLSQPLVEKRCG
jgi:ubiquinone/menaquinone biosynthesis C-methylase UbiE